ncbi:MAG: NAD(P)-binding domain-containing protein [Cyclobacteriaceae bacterium]
MNNHISIMGCGWLGLPLAKHLVKEGFSVKGSTTTPDKIESIENHGIIPFLLKAGQEGKDMSRFLQSDLLVLNIPPGKSNEESYISSMKSMAEIVALSPIRKVVYISTSSVYPNTNSIVSEEDASYQKTPRSGISMLEVEDIWRGLTDITTLIIRFAGLYGPGRNPGRFLAGKETSGGSNPVNLIHLDDCIGIIEHFVHHEYPSATFNACAPIHPGRNAFYQQAAHLFGFDPPVFTAPESTDHKIVDSGKLLNVTKYRYRHPDPIASLPTLIDK